uniref:Uncharacterized protein n=1 Tax=Lutzomyia longipalpis TaxID=7200 RepID=A0A7G3B3N2_LUTLO
MKFVSTLRIRSVLFFSMASARRRAVLSVNPTFVRERSSKNSFCVRALNNCSNFSSGIFLMLLRLSSISL